MVVNETDQAASSAQLHGARGQNIPCFQNIHPNLCDCSLILQFLLCRHWWCGLTPEVLGELARIKFPLKYPEQCQRGL